MLLCLSSLLFTAAILADDSKSSSLPPPFPILRRSPRPSPSSTLLHGTRVIDNYRWLEDGNSPATQKWVAEEMAYTRALLDPLARPRRIHQRLTELLSIGSVTPPVIAGNIISIRGARACRTSPCLYVRDTARNGARPRPGRRQPTCRRRHHCPRLVSAQRKRQVRRLRHLSQRIGDVHAAHHRNPRPATLLPDTIERTRAACIAWMHDNSGFYYTRYPKKGDVPAGQEMYNRHVFFHELDAAPGRTTTMPMPRRRRDKAAPEDLQKNDQLIFGEGRDPEDWPNVSLSNDGRWLLITV